MNRFIKRFYLRIRIKLKHAFDAIRNERLKINLLQAIPFWIAFSTNRINSCFIYQAFCVGQKIYAYQYFITTPGCFF